MPLNVDSFRSLIAYAEEKKNWEGLKRLKAQLRRCF